MPERERAIRALLWIAAFCFAAGIFLSATQLLRGLPPTAPVAVGRVTIERASKLRDYAAALLFFIVIPATTIPLYRLGLEQIERFRRNTSRQDLVAVLFVAPFFLAPFLYLTTFKWGWPLLIPLAASQAGPWAVIAYERTRWLRRLFAREMAAFHALIVSEALAWILFRYVAVGKRIAHIPTLFLEIVFVAFFVALFWGAFLFIARLATFALGMTTEVALQRVAVAAIPMLLLPPLALMFVRGATAIAIVMPMVLVALLFALRRAEPMNGRAVRHFTAYAVLPFLLFCLSYASTASLTEWIDLFHRGESLGPASDYLRGKVPYRDVFVLHGLLEDGQLDAWLMQLFGRDVTVSLLRPVVLGSFAVAALWYLGMLLFDSIPLAFVTMLLGAVTTTDNERAFFEIAALALLLAAIRRSSGLLAAASGIVAGVTLFFSFDIGLYAVGGALLTLLVIASVAKDLGGTGGARRLPSCAGPAPRSLATLGMTAWFVVGVLAGAAPFIIYLALRGALGAFVTTSFGTLPRIIDAVWSIPFPDLTVTFRHDLNLHTISDFVLNEQFRYILNPLVIAIALLVIVAKKADPGLIALTAFALLTQRSALGRVDFQHQYFSAFLIGPMILALLLRMRPAGRVLMLPVLFVALWVPDIANARLDDTTHYLGRVSRVGWIDPAAEEIRHRIDAVRYSVSEMSRPNQPIFDFSNQPAFYFFCDRPNPTRFYQVPILSPRAFQAETIAALERAKPPVILRKSPQNFDAFDGIDNTIRAQAVASYINQYYSYARSVRGVELWRRKSQTPPLDVAAHLRRISLPLPEQIALSVARTRLVFPTVGSVPGANGTYWRSDLTLHNPHKESLSLDLRYVAGDVRIDRNVVLSGGRTIRWEDVVRTFFGAPESRGALWIEYRGARPPVARIKTYDAAHDAQSSIDGPLAMRDGATAGLPNGDLTIVGIPSGATRRVNVGVVNVGAIPATFRITVRSRNGQTIGKPFEEGLAEDESRLVSDIERELGVRVDESAPLHVTPIAGTIVAYATVVGANGDSQFLAAVPAQQ